MKTYPLQVFLAIVLSCPAAIAQMASFDLNVGSQMVKYNDPANMGRKPIDLDYRDVRGRYLWNDEWNPALIIMKAGNANKLKAVKLNFYSNDIHYLDKEGEMAAPIDKVKRIILYSNTAADTTTVVDVFDIIPDPTTRKNYICQIMNDGDIQLLKRTSAVLKKERFDPSTGKDEFRFNSSTDYFIRNQAIVKPLKTFGKAGILEIVPTTSTSEDWLASNKNKLKKPEDIVEFFNYLNSQSK